MGEPGPERAQVMRGDAGPFPGARLGQAIAYVDLVAGERFPASGWRDFPPAAITALAALPAPLAAWWP